MRFRLTLYCIFISLTLISCNKMFFEKTESSIVYLAQYGLEGTDTLIFFEDGYFYYNDGEIFSEGHWAKINNKTICLFSNKDVLENKLYQTEKIDTLEISDTRYSGYIIHYSLIYHQFMGDTCHLINNRTLKFNLSTYSRN